MHEIRSHPWLSSLIAFQLAVGVAAFVATTQLQLAMGRDPLPGKSAYTWHIQLDPRSSRFALDGIDPPPALTWQDAGRVASLFPGVRQTQTVAGQLKIIPQDSGKRPFFIDARAVSSDFFTMFDVPVTEGSAWGIDTDANRNRVAVIARSLADRLFGASSAVGKVIATQAGDYKVIGVEPDWNPSPRFFDLAHKNIYSSEDQMLVPFTAVPHIDDGTWGDVDCWESDVDFSHLATQPCHWIQQWIQAPGLTEEAVESRLVAYSRSEKEAGHYQLPPNVRVRTVGEWLSFSKAVPREVALESSLAWAFFAVCLVNTMALMIAKFSRMRGNLALRRALGASRRQIAAQLTVEAGGYGILGGALGAMLSVPLAVIIRYQDLQYANVGASSVSLGAFAFGIALLGSLIAASLPVWRGLQHSIHTQMKQR